MPPNHSSRLWRNLGLAAAGALFAAPLPGLDPTPLHPRIAYPPDAGVVVVTAHGVANDGRTDITAPFQALLDKHGVNTTYYFPNGTYLVTDTIKLNHLTRITIVGETRDGVVFQLSDRNPKFQDPGSPREVLQSSQRRAQSFWINWLNFTVDVGASNPGAIGMEYGANNQGTLRDVVIRDRNGAGHCGLDTTGPAYGPFLVQNVIIEGFSYGMEAARSIRVLDTVAFRKQRIAAIRNNGAGIFASNIAISGTPAAYLGVNEGRVESNGPVLVLTDSNLDGTGQTAINGGDVYLRSVNTSGFRATVAQSAGDQPAPAVGRVEEWCSRKPTTLFGAASARHLPYAQAPLVPWSTDFATWANPLRFRRPADGEDDAPAIQRAIDSGAATIYLPNLAVAGDGRKAANWNLRSPITIKPSVQRIVSCGSHLHHDNIGRSGFPLWITEGASPEPLALDLVMSLYGLDLSMRFAHRAKRPLVIRACTEINLESTSEAGDIWAYDVTSLGWRLRNRRAYIVQYNPEAALQDRFPISAKLETHGTETRILGYKSEMEGDLAHVHGGALDILGGMFYGGPGSSPLIQAVDADANLIMFYEIIGQSLPRGYYVLFEDTQGGTTRGIHRNAPGVLAHDPRASFVPCHFARAGARGGVPLPWVQGGYDHRMPVGEPFSFTPRFQSAGKPRFGAANLPAGLTIDAQTGTISGTPSAGSRNHVEITIADEHGSYTTGDRLNAGCPIIEPIAEKQVRAGAPLVIPLKISGLKTGKKGKGGVELSGNPRTLRLDKDGLQISGTMDQPGRHLLRLIARNEVGGTVHDFWVMVTPP